MMKHTQGTSRARIRNAGSTLRAAGLVFPLAFATACAGASSSTLENAGGGGATSATSASIATSSTSSTSVSSSASGSGTAASTSATTATSGASSSGASNSGASTSTGAGGGGTPGVRFIGRFDESTPSKPQFEWTGSAVEANFEGTSVSVTLGGPANYFTALVDGANEVTFATTGQSAKYPIATGLNAGTHTVLLYRLDEASGNANSFEGFDFAGGQLLAPPAPPSHAIEMIGDSITAGYGNECMTGGTGFTPDMENGYLTYGAITGRDLGADTTVIAWSGKGVHVNYGGSTTDTMPELWLRTLPTDAASTWDFSRWTPGAVVINLGTNDFSAKVAPADYQSSYLSLVQQVHGKYPSATIFCALGPMLNDPDLSTARTAIGNVIDAMKTSGFTQMELVEFPVQDGSVGYGCDYHPNLATHQKMAVVLEQAIHAKLGW